MRMILTSAIDKMDINPSLLWGGLKRKEFKPNLLD